MSPKKKLLNIAVFAFAFSLNFETFNLLGLNIDYLSTKITIVFLLMAVFFTDKSFFKISTNSHLIIPIILYFLILTVVSIMNINYVSSAFFDLPLFLNILIFLIFLNISSKYPLLVEWAILVFAFSTALLSVLSILNIGTSIVYTNRYTIFGLNANELSLRSSISLLILLRYLLESNNLKIMVKGLLVLIMLSLSYMIIRTGSRVGFISFVLGIGIYVFYNKGISILRKIVLQSFALIVLFFTWFFYLKDSLVVARLFDAVNTRDFSSRDFIWEKVIEIIEKNYVWGVGKTGYAQQILDSFTDLLSPHNVFIEVLCYTGIVGMIPFLIFLYRILKRAWYKRKRFNNPMGLIFFVHLLGMMLSGQIFAPKVAWLLLAYICAHDILEVRLKNRIR